VVHLGTDVPTALSRRLEPPTLVTVGHLVARKRHADVLRALAQLPDVRYVVIGDGPEREPLRLLAGDLGVADRVELVGQLDHDRALARARACSVFVMPSVDEAFGVAYVEAMAAGLPAIGCAGEAGPEEIAAVGEGIRLVPAGDVSALVDAIEVALEDASLGERARETVERAFTWERCGAATVQAYEDALR
jgi:glycosyltransferase involved in cell wall biosynthesis